jgi:UDPglucose--hexose-1-phosphate uridylyltransferase
MPELRRDPIEGRWVIVSTERLLRPTDFPRESQSVEDASECPFCEGHESETPPEILAHRGNGAPSNGPGWKIRVVPNKFPALRIEGDLEKRGEGIYDRKNGIGAHEVIVESPRHLLTPTALPDAEFRDILLCYRDRLVDLRRDPRFVYGLVFKNVGAIAGASLEHTHSQLIATPTIPVRVEHEMAGAEAHFRLKGRCLFCDILYQEQRDRLRVVEESKGFVVFEPFASRFPFETWVVPRRHQAQFESIGSEDAEDLARVFAATLRRIEALLGRPPYNYLLHTTPFDRTDSPSFHWHLEIIPRLTKVAGFEWGSGFTINPLPPERAAALLRGEGGIAAPLVSGNGHG